jgi:hypothetical protein
MIWIVLPILWFANFWYFLLHSPLLSSRTLILTLPLLLLIFVSGTPNRSPLPSPRPSTPNPSNISTSPPFSLLNSLSISTPGIKLHLSSSPLTSPSPTPSPSLRSRPSSSTFGSSTGRRSSQLGRSEERRGGMFTIALCSRMSRYQRVGMAG